MAGTATLPQPLVSQMPEVVATVPQPLECELPGAAAATVPQPLECKLPEAAAATIPQPLECELPEPAATVSLPSECELPGAAATVSQPLESELPGAASTVSQPLVCQLPEAAATVPQHLECELPAAAAATVPQPLECELPAAVPRPLESEFPEAASESVPSVPLYLRELQLSPEEKELIASLPVEDSLLEKHSYQYQGFWFDTKHLVGLLSCQKRFEAQETDVLVVSYPKAGTTWLKALAFAVMKRAQFPDTKQHPLSSANPHEIVPYLELSFFEHSREDFDKFGHPRLLGSHLPAVVLPKSVHEKGCKLVYVWRDPKDTFISLLHFLNKIKPRERKAISLDEAIDKFSKGITSLGPFWEHVLSYWKESVENPKRVLFLRYEAMKEDPKAVVKKLSEFLNCPFSPEEEASGVVEEIVKLCSFDSLSNLDVNKTGTLPSGFPNDAFFRQGKVGDSRNFLSPENAKLIDEITKEKFASFNLIP